MPTRQGFDNHEIRPNDLRVLPNHELPAKTRARGWTAWRRKDWRYVRLALDITLPRHDNRLQGRKASGRVWKWEPSRSCSTADSHSLSHRPWGKHNASSSSGSWPFPARMPEGKSSRHFHDFRRRFPQRRQFGDSRRCSRLKENGKKYLWLSSRGWQASDMDARIMNRPLIGNRRAAGRIVDITGRKENDIADQPALDRPAFLQ